MTTSEAVDLISGATKLASPRIFDRSIAVIRDHLDPRGSCLTVADLDNWQTGARSPELAQHLGLCEACLALVNLWPAPTVK